jgi:hypothetical protein
MPVAGAVEHLVGLQAQNPLDPYLALWSRLQPFRTADLAHLLLQRKAVRIALMRSTIHLVSARDALALRPVVQPVLERQFRGSPYQRLLGDVDRREVVKEGRALLDQEPRTTRALGQALQRRWPQVDAATLGFTLRTFAPLVQVPPRGVWGASGAPRHTTLEHWLGRPLAAPDPEAVVMRYLKAFGPASVRDVQAWSGLTRLAAVLDRLRPRLRLFHDEAGVELFDLPRAARPDPRTPAPVRFLPEYDNVVLGHADRSRILGDHRPAVLAFGSVRWCPWLLDGFGAGMWRFDREGRHATLRVAPVRALAPGERRAVGAEGVALLAFAGHDPRPHHVRFEAGSPR